MPIGHASDTYWTRIKYLSDTHQVPIRQASSTYRTHIRYLSDTHQIFYFVLLMTLYLVVRTLRSSTAAHTCFSENKCSIKSAFLNLFAERSLHCQNPNFYSVNPAIRRKLQDNKAHQKFTKAAFVTLTEASTGSMGQKHSTARASGDNPESTAADQESHSGGKGFFSWFCSFFRRIFRPILRLFGCVVVDESKPEDPERGNLLPGSEESTMKRANEVEGGDGDRENPSKKARTEEESKGTSLFERLKIFASLTKPGDIELNALISNSDSFSKHVDFPVDTVRCKILQNEDDITKNILQDNANSAYPLLHESAVPLLINFLEYKKQNGSECEKALYANMDLVGLVQRLLDKRAVVFCGSMDSYLLLDGSKGHGGWDNVGKPNEKAPLKLSNCLSYDEIKLSALLSVSSHSVFINDGNRQNNGVPSSPSSIERHGVVIGLIGARFERENLMDWQEIMITKHQNTKRNGYGPVTPGSDSEKEYHWRKIWSDFYDVKPHLLSYEEVEKVPGDRFVTLPTGIFDNEVFKKRLSVSFETLILEAQHRAEATNKKAYVHVIGIGMGVWMISRHQQEVFMDAFASSLRRLLPKLTHVADINFSWFQENSCGGVKNKEMFRADGTDNKVRILFSRRNPHEKLPPEDSEKLLIVSYAWDGNSLPGNEFWFGQLFASGDPAQAASCQIAELHNPHINKNKVSGNNLHIASTEWGVLHISDYSKKLGLSSHL